MNEMQGQSYPVEQVFREQLSRLSKEDSRRKSFGITLMVSATLVSIALLGAMVFQTYEWSNRAERLRAEAEALKGTVVQLGAQARQLQSTQSDLLDFLQSVTAGESIHLVDPSVDWLSTKAYLISLPASPRKSAVLSAILLAWKDMPFSLQNRGLRSGLDSPHFINEILSRYRVEVKAQPGQRLSDAMMRTFQRTEKAEPGDLLFYRGNVGSFVLMYIGPGRPSGKGVAVGTLQTGEELRVLDTAFINTPVYPFLGYYRVPFVPSNSSAR